VTPARCLHSAIDDRGSRPCCQWIRSQRNQNAAFWISFGPISVSNTQPSRWSLRRSVTENALSEGFPGRETASAYLCCHLRIQYSAVIVADEGTKGQLTGRCQVFCSVRHPLSILGELALYEMSLPIFESIYSTTSLPKCSQHCHSYCWQASSPLSR
jgi:hypothetical protein